MATRGTVFSGAYVRELHSQNPEIQVFQNPSPLLIPLIEEGWMKRQETKKIIKYYLRPLMVKNIDTLILGCTHYPLLAGLIQKILGSKVQLINSAEETARQTRQLLGETAVLKEPEVRFYVSDEPEPFRTLGERFLGTPIHSVAKIGDHFKEGLLNV